MSLGTVYNDSVRRDLDSAVLMLVGPRNTRAYREIAANVAAFDGDGNPRAELRASPSGRHSAIALRLSEFLESYARIVTALWIILSTCTVLALILSGQVDWTKWQLQK
jgi:hypothetical protein